MRRLLAIFTVSLLFMGTAACTASTQEPKKVGEDNRAEGTDSAVSGKKDREHQADDGEAKDKIFHAGDKVQLDDRVLTVTNVERSDGTEIDQPDKGMVYVVVTVKIQNKGSENISYNPLNFKLKNSKGQINRVAMSLVAQDTQLHSGELAPGGKVSGTLVFSAPEGDQNKDLTLILQPNFLMEDHKIKINLDKK